MISFLRGKIIELGKNHMVLDVQGVGYRLHMPVKALNSLAKIMSEVKVYTQMHFNQREGASELYGFIKKDDLEAFNLLTSISGIGPKNAMHILSSMEIGELAAAVSNEDDDYLRKISGLGPKTAKRLIVELKDKIDKTVFAQFAKVDLGQESEAMDALISLGYSKNLTIEALRKISKKNISVESKVKEALKILSRS
ncbi:MAG: Holliday junction branch migration protein RuvA [Patescibacteria group bacterium]